MISLRRVKELTEWSVRTNQSRITIGAGVPYADMEVGEIAREEIGPVGLVDGTVVEFAVGIVQGDVEERKTNQRATRIFPRIPQLDKLAPR